MSQHPAAEIAHPYLLSKLFGHAARIAAKAEGVARRRTVAAVEPSSPESAADATSDDTQA